MRYILNQEEMDKITENLSLENEGLKEKIIHLDKQLKYHTSWTELFMLGEINISEMPEMGFGEKQVNLKFKLSKLPPEAQQVLDDIMRNVVNFKTH